MQKPIQFQKVYKIVQVVKGRYFSVNQNGEIIKKSHTDDGEVVEYKLNHQTFPKDFLPALFVSDEANKDEFRNFYKITCNMVNRVVVMSGLASNVRPFVSNDVAVNKHPKGRFIRPPRPSLLCDSFIPLKIEETSF